MQISVVDFFCGCGGTSAGLRDAGMKILAGIDIDPIALRTYENNFPNALALNRDISKLSTKKFEFLVQSHDRPLLFAACAPCQPFSTQNRNKSPEDGRVDLLNELHKFIRKMKPEYILLENVPGLQRIEHGPFFKFTSFLKKNGYQFDYDIKDAKNYGVPQSRKRLVLIASRLGEISLPEETHGKYKSMEPYKTVWDTIKKYHPLKAGQKSSKIPNHVTAKVSDLNLLRLKHTPQGGDRRDWPKELLLECHKGKTGYTDTYGRLDGAEPAKTLTTKCISISNGRFGHPTQNRALSVREAAALQSFPDDFVFSGTMAQAAKQVGNAVPVDFAKAMGLTISNHYEVASGG